jgi:putative alpha-1,2-mannosidase
VQNVTNSPGVLESGGQLLSGYAIFPPGATRKVTVNVRVGTSFISMDQARRNIDNEIPDDDTSRHIAGPQTLERTSQITRSAWAEKLDRFALEGATEVQKEVFWTGVAHALQVSNHVVSSYDTLIIFRQYPSEQHEEGLYYSGYDGKIHKADSGASYTGYSIWVNLRNLPYISIV